MANGDNQDILNSLRELIDILNKGVEGDKAAQEKQKADAERSQVLKDVDATLEQILKKENELEDLQETIVELQKKRKSTKR